MALDIAPDHAGSVAAVGNMIGNVAAIVATNLVLITHDPAVSSHILYTVPLNIKYCTQYPTESLCLSNSCRGGRGEEVLHDSSSSVFERFES